jgi:N-acetylneuraminate synthase
MSVIKIGNRLVGAGHPTYFIADISANHDGSLERAKMLINLAAQAGADAAKFQNFRAEHIVSAVGFGSMGSKQSHQSNWKKSVFEVYQGASIPWEWTPILKQTCDEACIDYFSTPYDKPSVDMLDPYVPAYKIGSGDLTWTDMCCYIASKQKPVILATGASDIGEVQRIVSTLLAINPQISVLQCNTNYTGSLENFKHIHLNVLKTYRLMFPNVVVGLSDHTPGHATALGAVALGGRVVEKHFTDDIAREGPDHPFSMTPETWRDMVDRTRELEAALGHATKEVAANEQETVVVQRRCIRAAKDLPQGAVIGESDIEMLRPAPVGGIPPWDSARILGKALLREIRKGEHLTFPDLAK